MHHPADFDTDGRNDGLKDDEEYIEVPINQVIVTEEQEEEVEELRNSFEKTKEENIREAVLPTRQTLIHQNHTDTTETVKGTRRYGFDGPRRHQGCLLHILGNHGSRRFLVG
jgi:hypothetical protein